MTYALSKKCNKKCKQSRIVRSVQYFNSQVVLILINTIATKYSSSRPYYFLTVYMYRQSRERHLLPLKSLNYSKVKNSFLYQGIILWNEFLPSEQNAESLDLFKAMIKTWPLESEYALYMGWPYPIKMTIYFFQWVSNLKLIFSQCLHTYLNYPISQAL